MSSFTLLDDSEANSSHPSSRLYTDLQQELRCADASHFPLVMEQLQTGLQRGWYGVAVLTYELGVALQGVDSITMLAQQPSRILLYKRCQQLNRDQVSDWLQQQIKSYESDIAGVADLQSNVDENEFMHAIDRIQNYITAGDTYQVNYTFRFHFSAYGHISALYKRLRERQSVPYGALILLPDGCAVLSLSPELFIRHQQGKLHARPMKGTAAAFEELDTAANNQINFQRSKHLSADIKNRAENVMIVDLLRNDLSRVAKLGSVQVPHLFKVQRFNSVLQMTSSITAEVRDEVNLSKLIEAIYPCGSITGAPKYRTMQIIQEGETEPRGVYTGAIGWFDPIPPTSATKSIPDFCLSVPIRTLYLQAEEHGLRRGVMGVGAGIVYDSVPADEYQECLLKARFLTGLPAQFSLFETMHATRENGCRYLDRHLQRITQSAHYFGISLNVSEIKKQLDATCAELTIKAPHRLRLSVDGLGQIGIQTTLLNPINLPVKVSMATSIQQSNNFWLRHKTTVRSVYDQAWQTAEQQGAFDMLFCNEYGELTEGARSNILVKIDGHWITPPLTAGVLPGVMRAVLMDDPTWALTECAIHIDQLRRAEEIAVCNALRGVMPALVI